MTQLLISVCDAIEAATVYRAATSHHPHSIVGIVDVKDPQRGSLGAVPTDVLRQIIDAADPRIPHSVALGELKHGCILFPNDLLSHFDFAKVGLAGMGHRTDWKELWLEFENAMPSNAQLVLVAYLDFQSCDAPSLADVFEFAQTMPKTPVLIDTFEKNHGSTVRRLGGDQVKLLVRAARERGIENLVMAGSVQPDELTALLECEPNYIGVRGAICQQGRQTLDRQLLEKFLAQWISASQATPDTF